MGQENGTWLLLGLRWISDATLEHCALCGGMNGKEFFFFPGPGQTPVGGMPEPPLHPRCKCRVVPIYAYEREIAASLGPEGGQAGPDLGNPGISPYLHKDAQYVFGVYWCNDGRKWSDGPAYGNWGGGNWSGGRNPEKQIIDGIVPGNSGPIDLMDKCFEEHDGCYDRSQDSVLGVTARAGCDIRLFSALKGLDEDPRKWPGGEKRSEEELEYAKRYRIYAIWAFGLKIPGDFMSAFTGAKNLLGVPPAVTITPLPLSWPDGNAV